MRRVLCYTCVVSFVVYALQPRGGEFYGAGSHHRTAGRRFVPADRHRHGSGQERCAQVGNKQALSNLLVYIIVPAMVVNSYRMEFSAQILRNLLAAFGMSVLSVLLGTVITLLLTARKTGSRMPIFGLPAFF